MLSNASLLFALNSGCLNSHACFNQSLRSLNIGDSQPTPGPYGEDTFSSLLCLTLWKSYLFSCRTKLAKLLCLKCFGRMDLVNRSFYSANQRSRAISGENAIRLTSSTTKLSISSPHRTIDAYDGSSSILLCASVLHSPANPASGRHWVLVFPTCTTFAPVTPVSHCALYLLARVERRTKSLELLAPMALPF